MAEGGAGRGRGGRKGGRKGKRRLAYRARRGGGKIGPNTEFNEAIRRGGFPGSSEDYRHMPNARRGWNRSGNPKPGAAAARARRAWRKEAV